MEKPILICVAGGSASGKTTVVNEIKETLNSEDLIILKHDDYYKCQDHLTPEERKLTNYDHPSSLENDLLVQDLTKLPGFGSVIDSYYNDQLIPLMYDNQLFGIPETENFYVLYYRTDILEQLNSKTPI